MIKNAKPREPAGILSFVSFRQTNGPKPNIFSLLCQDKEILQIFILKQLKQAKVCIFYLKTNEGILKIVAYCLFLLIVGLDNIWTINIRLKW